MLRFDFWLMALLSVLFLFMDEQVILYSIASIVIHECGHLLVLCFLKIKPRKISFQFGTIQILSDRPILSQTQELLVVGAGCLANIVAVIAGHLSDHSELIVTNCAICLFNALPIFGLDGFDILRCFCTEKTTLRVSYIANIMLFLLGLVLVYYKNPTVICISVILYFKQQKAQRQ